MSAAWFAAGVSSVAPQNGQYDFGFDNSTGNITIYQLVNGTWTAKCVLAPNGTITTY